MGLYNLTNTSYSAMLIDTLGWVWWKRRQWDGNRWDAKYTRHHNNTKAIAFGSLASSTSSTGNDKTLKSTNTAQKYPKQNPLPPF